MRHAHQPRRALGSHAQPRADAIANLRQNTHRCADEIYSTQRIPLSRHDPPQINLIFRSIPSRRRTLALDALYSVPRPRSRSTLLSEPAHPLLRTLVIPAPAQLVPGYSSQQPPACASIGQGASPHLRRHLPDVTDIPHALVSVTTDPEAATTPAAGRVRTMYWCRASPHRPCASCVQGAESRGTRGDKAPCRSPLHAPSVPDKI